MFHSSKNARSSCRKWSYQNRLRRRNQNKSHSLMTQEEWAWSQPSLQAATTPPCLLPFIKRMLTQQNQFPLMAMQIFINLSRSPPRRAKRKLNLTRKWKVKWRNYFINKISKFMISNTFRLNQLTIMLLLSLSLMLWWTHRTRSTEWWSPKTRKGLTVKIVLGIFTMRTLRNEGKTRLKRSKASPNKQFWSKKWGRIMWSKTRQFVKMLSVSQTIFPTH